MKEMLENFEEFLKNNKSVPKTISETTREILFETFKAAWERCLEKRGKCEKNCTKKHSNATKHKQALQQLVERLKDLESCIKSLC